MWIKKAGRNTSNEVYHTDEDCKQLNKAAEYRETSDREIDVKGLRECAWCTGEAQAHTPEQDRSYHQRAKAIGEQKE